jgi:hypothetical protein
VDLERRVYGPESPPEVQAAIRSRVVAIEDGIIACRETPVMSVYTEGIMFEQVSHLSRDWDAFTMVVDVTDSQLPGVAVRRAIRANVVDLGERLKGVAVYFDRNLLLRVAAKHIFRAMSVPLDVQPSREQAIARCRQWLLAAGGG